MAQKLDAMPARAGRGTVHPWHEWADGSVWKVTRGVDFHSEVESFRTQLYGAARSRDMKVKVDVDRDAETIIFQMVKTEKEST